LIFYQILQKSRQRHDQTAGATMAAPKGYAHWAQTQGLMLTMLALWVLFSFAFHACLDYFNFGDMFGLPVSFLIAAQGSVVAFAGMLGWFCRRQHALDVEYRVGIDV
jgi:putative solute:sodium symporter small subunit